MMQQNKYGSYELVGKVINYSSDPNRYKNRFKFKITGDDMAKPKDATMVNVKASNKKHTKSKSKIGLIEKRVAAIYKKHEILAQIVTTMHLMLERSFGIVESRLEALENDNSKSVVKRKAKGKKVNRTNSRKG